MFLSRQVVLLFLLAFFGSYFVQDVEAAKILCFYPNTGKSHLFVAKALMQELAERGHYVTVVSGFPLSKPMKNYRDINVPLDDLTESLMESFLKNPSSETQNGNFSDTMRIKLTAVERALNLPEFKKIMEEESFDLVIVGFFVADYILALGNHFNCPTVMLFTVIPMDYVNMLTGNPIHHAVSSTTYLGEIHKPDTFFERCRSYYYHLWERYMFSLFDKFQEQHFRRNFPKDIYPSLQQIKRNVSLVLMNSHFSTNRPRPYLPNMIEVGGLHLNEKPSELPTDVKEWIEGAEHGAIFFSLGSNLKSTQLPEEKLDAILKTFSKLKQRILWKWEDDGEMPNKPDNVMLRKWFPQSSILAHENVKLFITHGGLGSINEAMFYGVPIVGVPVFYDQFGNTKIAALQGWAVNVHFEDLNMDLFSKAINEILTNKSYRETVQTMSKLYRDRPQHPMDTAVYWIEYVIRHKGATHMRYAAIDLDFFETNSLDVIGAAILLMLICSVILYKLLKKAFFSRKIKTD